MRIQAAIASVVGAAGWLAFLSLAQSGERPDAAMAATCSCAIALQQPGSAAGIVPGCLQRPLLLAQAGPASGQSGVVGKHGQPGAVSSLPGTTAGNAGALGPSEIKPQPVGIITVTGTVRTETERQAVETQLKRIPGIKLNNQVLVVGQTPPDLLENTNRSGMPGIRQPQP